jgi:hypothetical protein
MRYLRYSLVMAVLVTLSTHSLAQINMGMTGDSLTDDYLGGTASINNNLAAKSWGQILAESRANDLNFGGYKAVGDTWDAVRYSGYEYNWATSGGAARDDATVNFLGNILPVTVSGTSVLSTQTDGLAQMISNNQVDTAFVGIGSNDFYYHMNIITDLNGTSEPNPSAVIDQLFIDHMADSILSGVDDLLVAGGNSSSGDIDLLLALIPMGTAAGSTPEVLAGIEAVNAQLLVGAAERGVATVDLFGWAEDSSIVDEQGNVTIGGLFIELGSAASPGDLGPEGTGPCNSLGECATEQHANNYIAEDGLHPNTVIQGLIANEVIGTLNEYYGYSINSLNDEEILSVAGVTTVPVPAAAWLFASALLGLGVVKRRKA